MLKIIKCKECQSKFDVTNFEPGTTIKCSVCESILEVPPDKVAVQTAGSYFRDSEKDREGSQKEKRTRTSRTRRLSASELKEERRELRRERAESEARSDSDRPREERRERPKTEKIARRREEESEPSAPRPEAEERSRGKEKREKSERAGATPGRSSNPPAPVKEDRETRAKRKEREREEKRERDRETRAKRPERAGATQDKDEPEPPAREKPDRETRPRRKDEGEAPVRTKTGRVRRPAAEVEDDPREATDETKKKRRDPRESTDEKKKPEDAPRRTTEKARRATTRSRRKTGKMEVAEPGAGGRPRKKFAERTLLIAGGAGLLVVLGAALVFWGLSSGGSDGGEATKDPKIVRASLEAEYAKKHDESAGDAGALLELAEWCGKNGLPDRKKSTLEEIVATDPENEQARKALGQTRFQSKWYPAAEVAALEAWLGKVEQALGSASLYHETPHFDIVVKKDEEGDAAKDFTQSLGAKVEDVLASFHETHRADFAEKLEAGDLDRIPRRRIVVFPSRDLYKKFAEKAPAEAVDSEGYVDPRDGVCYLYNYQGFLDNLPFHEDFFATFYFKPEAPDGEPPPKHHVLSLRGLEAFQVLGPGAVVERSEHFLVAVQKDPGYSAKMAGKMYCSVLENLYRGFFEAFARDDVVLTPPDKEMPMFIFKDRESYVNYGAKTSEARAQLLSIAEGHYEPDTGRMVSFKQDQERNYGTILHEGTHLIFHYLAKNQSQLLGFNEGIADYFGGYKLDEEGRYVIGEPVNTKRLPILKQILSADPTTLRPEWRPYPIKELLTFTYNDRGKLLAQGTEFAQARMNVLYAQAWGLTHFLMHSGNPEYRKKYINYVKAELDKRTGPEVILQTFYMTDSELAKMEREFKDYVLKLE